MDNAFKKTLTSMQSMHQEGIAKYGTGAIFIFATGQWRFEPLARLRRFRHWKMDVNFLGSIYTTNQYQSDNLIDLVTEIAQTQSENFVYFRPIYRWRLFNLIFFDSSLSVKVCKKTDLSSLKAIDEPLEDIENNSIVHNEDDDDTLLVLDKMIASLVYVEGIKEKGQGAVLATSRGKFYFLSIAQLSRLEKYPQLGAFANLNISITKLIEQCPRERFILICKIYQLFYSFGKKIIVYQEKVLLPFGLKV